MLQLKPPGPNHRGENARLHARLGPPPIRVLHVINGEHYAGAERVQDLLAASLGPLGFEVGFACLKPGRFDRARQFRRAPLHELPMRHQGDLRPVLRLAGIIRREGYRLIHAHSARSALVAGLASLLTGVPLVQHVHSPTSRDSTRRCRDRLNALVERLVLRRASALIAVSASLAADLRRRGFPKGRIRVVHNGVPAGRLRRPRQRPNRVWTLGTIALFRPRKGIEVLLGALADLRSLGYAVWLRAVGAFETPQYEDQVRGLVYRLGLTHEVDWTGFARDVPGELAGMDLFVLPSLFGEGLPMVVLESMAAGVPVIATRVEGIPEAIRHGRDGVLVPAGDRRGLVTALRRVIDGQTDWSALRHSALQRQLHEFSDASMARGVAGVYRRVLRETCKAGPAHGRHAAGNETAARAARALLRW